VLLGKSEQNCGGPWSDGASLELPPSHGRRGCSVERHRREDVCGCGSCSPRSVAGHVDMTESTGRDMNAPDTQIENADVRVTRWVLGSGEETGQHTHEFSYVVVPLTPGHMRLTADDGQVSFAELAVGECYYRQGGARHNVRNDGSARLIFVEVQMIASARCIGDDSDVTMQ